MTPPGTDPPFLEHAKKGKPQLIKLIEISFDKPWSALD